MFLFDRYVLNTRDHSITLTRMGQIKDATLKRLLVREINTVPHKYL